MQKKKLHLNNNSLDNSLILEPNSKLKINDIIYYTYVSHEMAATLKNEYTLVINKNKGGFE